MGSIVNSFATLPGIEQAMEFYTNTDLFLPRSGFVQPGSQQDAAR